MTSNSSPTPEARADDGVWHVLLVRAPGPDAIAAAGSEAKAIRSLASDMKGSANPDLVKIIKTAAWRLEPAGFRSADMGAAPGRRTPAELALSMAEGMGWDKNESEEALDGAASEMDVENALRRLAARLDNAGAEDSAPKGWISVDGEQAQYGRVQVQVLPGRGRIITLALSRESGSRL